MPPPFEHLNPIALWLLIHGGDPGHDKEASQLTLALAIRQLAAGLSDSAARQQIQAGSGKVIAEQASALGRR